MQWENRELAWKFIIKLNFQLLSPEKHVSRINFSGISIKKLKLKKKIEHVSNLITT